MPSVFNVAKYVLNHVGDMPTMKLEKLVYYCQAWSLAWDDAPLFDEDFQAWGNGPVCPELFESHRGKFWLEKDYYDKYEYKFSDEQIETMDSVLSSYGEKSPLWLSELTHKERPWREIREENGVAPGYSCDKVIPKELMQEYYGWLMRLHEREQRYIKTAQNENDRAMDLYER